MVEVCSKSMPTMQTVLYREACDSIADTSSVHAPNPAEPWKCGICTLSKGEHGDSDYGWMVFGLFRLGERSDRRGRDKFPMLKGFKPTPLSATDVNQAQLLAGNLLSVIDSTFQLEKRLNLLKVSELIMQ
ncbi:hypothetical protein D5086_026625 [Populus alba]|uniref:Uncharacterized protein n=1 Tax=Populus alba TaxID=43335 RepID=A0ACC4B362_POPAL